MNSNKIITSLDQFLIDIKKDKNNIVFTNGCFDLLHEGHLHLLKEAKKLGDILIVAVNDDASVKRLKGIARPIESLAIRIQKLADLNFVDYVISFSEDTPLQLIQKIQPTYLVKGGDYSIDEIIGKEFAENIKIIPLLEGFSTTQKIASLKK
ncbi:MAG: adenylyltransferase/cytidyltransferase family protein [Bacteroidetes bacterium]|nr:adenylyltransferase/cytidyltransferase family protein [Bacteroidota bacterium]